MSTTATAPRPAFAWSPTSAAVDAIVVVLGGGVAEAGAPLLDAVRDELRAAARRVALLGELDLASRLVLAPSDAALGAVGAALLAGHG